MKSAKKKRSASDWLPVLLLIAVLLFLTVSDYNMSGSQEKQAEPVIGQDQWEYYFTPFYECEETKEESSGDIWTMPPVSNVEARHQS